MATDKTPASGGDDDQGLEPNALTTNQSILQYFWDLASYDEDVRLTAARGLVKDLAEDQTKHLATLGKDTEPAPEDAAPKIKQLEYHLRRCSPTMVYTLRRLARGLSSSRAGARQGYATSLAGLLAATRCLTPAGVLVLLEVCNDRPNKSGDKDTLMGRMFGFGALLRSGLPLESATLAAVFNGLLDCGQRKSFLRECAVALALEAAAQMDADTVAAVAAAGKPLAALLATPPAEAPPETLLLALVLWPRLPPAAVRTCKLLPADTPPPPPELFATAPAAAGGSAGRQPLTAEVAAAAAATAAGLFSREHLRVLQPVLLATSAAHPRMHTLWQYLLPLLLPGFRPHRNMDLELAAAAAAEPPPPAEPPADGGDTKAAKAAAKAAKAAAAAAKSAEGKGAVSGPLLEAFWGVVVEGGLMGSSHERQYLAFQLFSRVLPHLRAEHVATVFSPAFTRVLTHCVKRRDTHLHASAKRLVDGISAFLERGGGGGGGPDTGLKLAVAAALQKLGGMAPKELAEGKLTKKLVQGMDSSGVHLYLGSLREAFLKGAAPLQPGEGEGAAAGANGHPRQEGGEEETEQDREQAAASRRQQCVEQLVTALRLPEVAEADVEAGLHFLALHAFTAVAAAGGKSSKSKLPEVQQAAALLPSAPPLTAATRTACAARLVGLLSSLHQAAQHRLRVAAEQQHKHLEQQRKAAAAAAAAAAAGASADDAAADAAAAAGQPAAKKRKTAVGAAAAAGPAADAAGAAPPLPPPSILYHHLHDTLSYVRRALKAPGVSAAVELSEEAEASLALLTAIETAALERLAALDAAHPPAAATSSGGAKGKGKDKGKEKEKEKAESSDAAAAGVAAARLRSLAALAAHMQLHLLADPEGFEQDLPLSLRKVAAEGLGLEGLPEVEVQEVEDEEGAGASKPGPGAAAAASTSSWCDVLVDMLLALMARPGGSLPIAPLRDAGEALWRQCCEGLSGEGLNDLVRVVAAGGKGEGQDEEGLFESDEEEEEEEESGGSEEEEDDEEEEVEEDEGEGKKAAGVTKKRKKAEGEEEEGGSEDEEEGEGKGNKGGKKAKGAEGSQEEEESEGGSDGEEGSEEDEGMDDEAMFRMDEKLAAYFRSMVGGKAGGKAAEERAAALVNFRLRALALLETYGKKVPNSPLLLASLVPLVRSLATASRPGGQPQVAARLRGVLLGKLCKCRCKLEDVGVLGGVEGFRAALKRLLYEASRNRDKKVAEVAGQALTAVLRAGGAAEDAEVAEAAQSAFRAALSDLLTKKKTRLQPAGLLAAFQAAPAAGLPSLDLLLQTVAAGRNPHVRLEAAELLRKLLRSPPEGLAAALEAGGSAGPGAALGAALAACVAGVGLKAKQHAQAAKAAVMAAEGLKKLLGGKRPAEVLGADKINAIAKAVVTVQSLSPPSKVVHSLKRLSDVMALGPLLEKTKPDPALAARIAKAMPEKPAAVEQKEGKAGKEGKKEKKGKKEEVEKSKKDKKDKEEKKKRKAQEEEEEQEDEDGEEDEDSEAEEEPGSEADEPSSSGDGDDDGDEDDEAAEEEELSDSDEEPAGGKAGRGRDGKAGKGRDGKGGKGDQRKRRHKHKKQQGNPGHPKRHHKGEGKRPEGGKGAGGGDGKKRHKGGSPAKKARR